MSNGEYWFNPSLRCLGKNQDRKNFFFLKWMQYFPFSLQTVPVVWLHRSTHWSIFKEILIGFVEWETNWLSVLENSNRGRTSSPSSLHSFLCCDVPDSVYWKDVVIAHRIKGLTEYLSLWKRSSYGNSRTLILPFWSTACLVECLKSSEINFFVFILVIK